MEPQPEESLESLRATVCRKIGSCMLRLQQYELLMKRLLANREILAYLNPLETSLANRKRELSNKTLGQLVGELTQDYLFAQAFDQSVDEAASLSEPERPCIHTRVQLEMTKQEYERTKDGLGQILSLRNELVHHFLERFDLAAVPTCHSAEAYLDSAYRIINEQYEVLVDWCRLHDEARKNLAAVMETPEFECWFKFGVFPGQNIEWSNTTIVHQLVAAENNHHEDGWTNLDKAIATIRKKWPELTPGKYGCASWRQVVHESRLFDIQKRADLETGVGQTWYRSKSGAR